jgi:hypothetical protein
MGRGAVDACSCSLNACHLCPHAVGRVVFSAVDAAAWKARGEFILRAVFVYPSSAIPLL